MPQRVALGKFDVVADHHDIYVKLGLDRHDVSKFHSEAMNTWADWLIILTAKSQVLHSGSGFSESALRVSPHRELLTSIA